MLHVFTTGSTFRAMCLEEYKEMNGGMTWYKIINDIKHVVLDEKVNLDSDVTNNEIILRSMADGIYIETDEEYFDRLKTDYSAVLEHPDSVFLLDLDSRQADMIQENYGVICQSTNNLDEKILTLKPELYSLRKNRQIIWKEIFREYQKLPSNAIVIADRYVFQKSNSGLENVIEILDAVMPIKSLGYEVTIITSYYYIDSANRNDKIFKAFKEVAKTLLTEIQKLRKYPILINFIGASTGSKLYESIHDRHILSNYYYVDFTYNIDASKDGESKHPQSLEIKSIYCNGTEYRGDGPRICREDILDELIDGVEMWKQNQEEDRSKIIISDYMIKNNVDNFKSRLIPVPN